MGILDLLTRDKNEPREVSYKLSVALTKRSVNLGYSDTYLLVQHVYPDGRVKDRMWRQIRLEGIALSGTKTFRSISPEEYDQLSTSLANGSTERDLRNYFSIDAKDYIKEDGLIIKLIPGSGNDLNAKAKIELIGTVIKIEKVK